jgi:saccharopine dehydrogenase (NAD+, L-lysine forming)
MSKVLIIGAGGVGTVVAHKCALNSNVFTEIMLASRTVSKCERIAADIKEMHGVSIKTAAVDADNVPELVKLIQSFQPKMVINVALPYQDLTIMDACLETGVHYLDTANYEPKDVAKFEYSWQWAYQERFKTAGLMALLGCGFDPGVTQVYTAYANKHYFDEMHYLDIIDCNAGDHGKAFATNFNPEINIREITQPGRYWENGEWVEIPAMSIHKPIDYPNIGPKESYVLYHEELESLVKNFPTLKRARFWMTFGQAYITHLQVLENVGMTSIAPIKFQGMDIVPLEFLKAVLPAPESLGENYTGQTSIGCQIKGIKDGKDRTYYVWNNCHHGEAYKEVKSQAVSYTTGVPAMIGAMLMLTNEEWLKPGVYNVEELNPDPFMDLLNIHGLPWNEQVDGVLPHEYHFDSAQ